MAEVVITYWSVVGNVDATISIVNKIIKIIQSYRHKQEELSYFSAEIGITKETLENLSRYLKDRESMLDPTVKEFLRTNAMVIKELVSESDALITKNTTDNKFIYAVAHKPKLLKLSKKLKAWTTLIQGHVQAFQAIDTARNARTLEDIRASISGIREDQKLGELIDMVQSLTIVPSLIEKLSEQMGTIVEVTKIRDKQTVDDNDLAKITIHKNELERYKTSQDQWEDILKRNGEKKDVLVERIQLGKTKRREEIRKLALILHQLGPPQNILKFEGILEDTSQTTLFVSCGDFKDTLYDLVGSEMETPSPLVRIQIAYGVACAFAFLHEAGIYHRNLRSIYIYIDTKTMTPYLSGFANARRTSDTSMARNSNMSHDSFLWEAPERVGRIVAEFGRKCEVYTFGVLLLVIGYWNTLENNLLEIVWNHLKIEEKSPTRWDRDDYEKMKEAMAKNSEVLKVPHYDVLVQECKKGRNKIMEAGHKTAETDQKSMSPYTHLVEKCIKLKAQERPTFMDIREELLQISDDLEVLATNNKGQQDQQDLEES